MDFHGLETYCFKPHIFDSTLYFVSCGFNCAALLTGVSPYKIQKEYKKKKIAHSHELHCDEKFLLDYLRKTYEIIEITGEAVLHSELVTNNVNSNHLLLIRQAYSGKENSFSVVWKDYIYHNFCINPFKPLELVNRPPKNTYILKKRAKRNRKNGTTEHI